MYLQKVKSRKTFLKISFLFASLRSMTEIAGSGSVSGSISQSHRSTDPDLYQNVMDLQHCKKEKTNFCRTLSEMVPVTGKKNFMHFAQFMKFFYGKWVRGLPEDEDCGAAEDNNAGVPGGRVRHHHQPT
jgi:hypothetical protein